MKELLFLAHRIPFPPNKGDKIRSYNLLIQLAQDYRVHLGAFIDDPQDWRYVDELQKLCGEVHFVDLDPRAARLRSLAGLWRGEALSLCYYRNASLQAWVDTLLARSSIQRVLVFSSAMAQYVNGPDRRHLLRIIDFVDVDSDKWLQYACSKSWPMSWLYRREGRTLLRFERTLAADFAASVFVTPEECALFKRLAPETVARIHYAENGVDTDYFNPEQSYPNPYSDQRQVLVFTGAMDYWANVDGVQWFAREIFPLIHQVWPEVCFYIVGARPAAEVQQLDDLPGVHVTGGVPDVRPYLAHAKAAVAPLRIARGVQNKVLEAMAMGKPVLATQAAIDGIVPCSALMRWVADEPKPQADLAMALLQKGDEGDGSEGRAWVLQHYDWAKNLSLFKRLLDRKVVAMAEDRATAPLAVSMQGD